MPQRPTRVPPARLVVRAVDRTRTALQKLNRTLLARAGFRLNRIVETASPMMSIIEAVPA